MRATILSGALLAIGLLAACATTPIPRDDLRSGMSQKAALRAIGRAPESTTRFRFPDQPEMTFTVLDYYLAPKKNWPEGRYWILLNEQGLISYGRGGVREAKARAFDAYYDWMARQGALTHGEAERRLAKTIAKLYRDDLNPEVNAYLAARIAVMTRVDRGEITLDEAKRLIDARFAEIDAANGRRDPTRRQRAGQGRAAALSLLGLDVLSSRLASRPRAGKSKRSIACTGGGGLTTRCY